MPKIYPQEPTVRRMSQKCPNIQQIRKSTPEFRKIREAFAEEVMAHLVETDYSDIEKRIMETFDGKE